MNADERRQENYLYPELTREIIGGAFEVSNALGCGFLEKVYENALAVELRRRGLKVAQQVAIHVVYKNETVGEYMADMIVEDAVLVEMKATSDSGPVFLAQTLNYLKATRLPVGLILNFGQPRLTVQRVVLSHELARQQHEIDLMMEQPADDP